MWATSDPANNPLRVLFWITRRRIDIHSTTVAGTMRAEQFSIDMCSRTGLLKTPASVLGVRNRVTNMFIRMFRHWRKAREFELPKLATKAHSSKSTAIGPKEGLLETESTEPDKANCWWGARGFRACSSMVAKSDTHRLGMAAGTQYDYGR